MENIIPSHSNSSPYKLTTRSPIYPSSIHPPAGKPTSSSSAGSEGGFLNPDTSKSVTKFYHTSALALVGLTPLAFILSPSWLNFPVDLTLGVLFPLHSHIGLNYVITDYVPKAARAAARTSLLVCTVIAAAGIFKLNVTGPGLTEALKALWRTKKAAPKVAADHH